MGSRRANMPGPDEHHHDHGRRTHLAPCLGNSADPRHRLPAVGPVRPSWVALDRMFVAAQAAGGDRRQRGLASADALLSNSPAGWTGREVLTWLLDALPSSQVCHRQLTDSAWPGRGLT